MDGQTLMREKILGIPATPPEQRRDDGHLAAECRMFISVLSRKIETLCHECSEDVERVTYIKSLTASLTTLDSLLKTLEHEQLYRAKRDFFEDARGFTYHSVRCCDMERISDK